MSNRVPSKPMTQRQIKAHASRNHIFDTAIRLMKRDGYENTGINAICREAGVSIGAFYHYFESKQSILSELYSRADHFFESHAASWVLSHDPVERIKEYMALYIHFVHLEGVDMCRNLYKPENKLFVIQDRLMLTLLEDIIRRGQEKGKISKKFTPSQWVNFVFLVLRGLAFDWVLRSGEYEIEEYAKSHIECVGNYLRVLP
jgi:AcrR family transcriptional regulator